MGAGRRVRAYAGLWCLVGLLAAGLVFGSAAAGPSLTRLEDRALREAIEAAPDDRRDLTVTWPAPGTVATTGPSSLDLSTAGAVRDAGRGFLPSGLAGALGSAWGSQGTDLRRGSLAGAGVAATNGFLPAVRVIHHTDVAPEVTVVEGSPPATDPVTTSGSGATAGVVEVMVAVEVAERLGLRVGEEYDVVAAGVGSGITAARAAALPQADRLPVRVAGVFRPRDAGDPIWRSHPRLLTVGRTAVDTVPPSHTAAATIATDQAGVDLLIARGLATPLRLTAAARLRFDPARVDADWTGPAAEEVARLGRDPRLAGLGLQTGLAELIDDFRQRAAASRAVAAVVLAGSAGTGVGLLILAGVLMVDRRRAELSLLRARGGSVAGVAGLLAAEAALVTVPAALVGWLAQVPLPGGWAQNWPAGLAVVAAWLVVPVVGVVSPTGGLRGRPGPQARAGDLTGRASPPWRLPVELFLAAFAGLGVWLLHRRGLAPAGTDPFLSAVPLLVALAAGLLALRVYPWPVRGLAALSGRSRGPVWFLGLATAGRAGPGAALPLLVVVLAMAVGGFAGGVFASVQAERDRAAVAAVGAHIRLAGEGLDATAVDAARTVPGVDAVTPVGRAGDLYSGESWLPDVVVVALDPVSYQENLASLGLSGQALARLGPGPGGGGPVPVLASPALAGSAPLSIHDGQSRLPVTIVGDVGDLPGPEGRLSTVVVSRAAFASPPAVDELLVAGAGADPARVRAQVATATGAGAGAISVSTLAGRRAELAGHGFNASLNLVFVSGVVAAAVGALLAVGLALVTRAPVRAQTRALLRTMGLTRQQARGVTLLELLPPAVVAVGVGTAAGLSLPGLIAPALGLAQLSA